MYSVFLSKLRSLLGMKPRMAKEEAYILYQLLCDEIFGSGAIKIKPAQSNLVIGTLCHLDDFLEFKKNFKKRLIRLRDHFKGTASYQDLLNTVMEVADQNNWKGAYGELAAYDFMWNDNIITPMVLDNTLPGSDSYACQLLKNNGRAYNDTNEDGYLDDYDLYFDVKILSDTVLNVLKGVIDDAIANSSQQASCNILPEYPLDDDEEEYSINRTPLYNELLTFLSSHNTTTSGNIFFRSSVIPRLGYRVHWGGGVNSAISSYNPYRHAEETKHLIFKRYTKKIMKNKPFMLVLVNFPWYNNRVSSFINADQVYYRSLARRTFCGYIGDGTLLNTIVPNFVGTDTIFEVSRHLAGIIFIDDHCIKKDSYSCNVIMNPNAANTNTSMVSYIESLVAKGDKRSMFDDLIYDNY